MGQDDSAGPLRLVFHRGEGVFRYLSPGFLILSALSLINFGIFPGLLGVFFAGFMQDWANREEFFSWVRKLSG